MAMEAVSTGPPDLETYAKLVWGGLEGTIWIGKGDSGGARINTHVPFDVPKHLDDAVEYINRNAAEYNIYATPSVFLDSTSRQVVNFKSACVAFAECDGNAPSMDDDIWDRIPRPSMVVQSSVEGKAHFYWALESPTVNAAEHQRINKYFVTALNGDKAVHDSARYLRPAGSAHRKDLDNVYPVKVIYTSSSVLSHEEVTAILDQKIEHLQVVETAVSVSTAQATTLTLIDVINANKLHQDTLNLLQGRISSDDRSGLLMRLSDDLARAGLTDTEMFVVLRDADPIIGLATTKKSAKYANHPSEYERMIIKSRTRVPAPEPTEGLRLLSPNSVVNMENVVEEGLVEDILIPGSSTIISGTAKTGKSTVAMCMVLAGACGRDSAVGYEIGRPFKTLYAALDTSIQELKGQMTSLKDEFTDAEWVLIDENLSFVQPYEGLNLLDQKNIDKLVDAANRHKAELIVLDTMRDIVSDTIAEHEVAGVMKGLEVDSRESQRCYLLVHHTTKKSPHTRVEQIEVFGTGAWAAKASVGLGVYTDENNNTFLHEMFLRNRAKDAGVTKLKRNTHGYLIAAEEVNVNKLGATLS